MKTPHHVSYDGQQTEINRGRSNVYPLHGMLPALFSACAITFNEVYSWTEIYSTDNKSTKAIWTE